MNTKKIPQGPKIIEIPKNSLIDIHQFIPIFPNFNSIILDLGVGTGQSSLMLCQKHPESLIVAVERTLEKFQKFKSKMLKLKECPANLLAIHTDYNVFLQLIWAEISSKLKSVHWFYPNPCLKNKNKHHRFYNQDAFKLIAQNSDINLEIRSDQEKQLYQVATLLNRKSHIQSFEPTTPFVSAFEKKYFEQKRNLYRLVTSSQA